MDQFVLGPPKLSVRETLSCDHKRVRNRSRGDPQEAGVQGGCGEDVFSRKTTFLELDRCSEAREPYGK